MFRFCKRTESFATVLPLPYFFFVCSAIWLQSNCNLKLLHAANVLRHLPFSFIHSMSFFFFSQNWLCHKTRQMYRENFFKYSSLAILTIVHFIVHFIVYRIQKSSRFLVFSFFSPSPFHSLSLSRFLLLSLPHA